MVFFILWGLLLLFCKARFEGWLLFIYLFGVYWIYKYREIIHGLYSILIIPIKLVALIIVFAFLFLNQLLGICSVAVIVYSLIYVIPRLFGEVISDDLFMYLGITGTTILSLLPNYCEIIDTSLKKNVMEYLDIEGKEQEAKKCSFNVNSVGDIFCFLPKMFGELFFIMRGFICKTMQVQYMVFEKFYYGDKIRYCLYLFYVLFLLISNISSLQNEANDISRYVNPDILNKSFLTFFAYERLTANAQLVKELNLGGFRGKVKQILEEMNL